MHINDRMTVIDVKGWRALSELHFLNYLLHRQIDLCFFQLENFTCNLSIFSLMSCYKAFGDLDWNEWDSKWRGFVTLNTDCSLLCHGSRINLIRFTYTRKVSPPPTRKSFREITNTEMALLADREDTGCSLLTGFGGLEVACCPLVPKFADSNPTEAVGFFRAKKILSTPSFGGEVKPFVPCRRYTACKRSVNVTWKSGIFRQNSSAISRPSSSSFLY